MSSQAAFGINGRFLTQPVTGVQRYARNVIAAMDLALAQKGISAPIIAPVNTRDPALSMLPLIAAGPLQGHLWEQATLPSRWRERLLNLCNTAPAMKADQVVCIHDANIFVTSESYSTAFRIMYSTLHRALAQRVARLSTVSHYSAQQIARHLQVKASEIAVLPNGHEHALAWEPTQAELAPALFERHPEMGERRFVLALGSRARHKNFSCCSTSRRGSPKWASTSSSQAAAPASLRPKNCRQSIT